MTTACNGEIALTKNSQIVADEHLKKSLKASFTALPELPASFIKANANPRLPRLLGADLDTERDTRSREESIAELKASVLQLPAPPAAQSLGGMKPLGGSKPLGGMKKISSKVSISDMVEAWEIPLADDDDDDEGPVAAPVKTMKAVKAEQLPSPKPRHVRNSNEEVGCCAAGLKRVIRFVFFGF